MKNQNDIIISIVAGVLCIGFSIAFFFMKREPVAPQEPQQVTLTKVTTPDATVSWANGLPGGGNSGSGGSRGGFGGPSFGGAPGGSGAFGAPGMAGVPGGSGGTPPGKPVAGAAKM